MKTDSNVYVVPETVPAFPPQRVPHFFRCAQRVKLALREAKGLALSQAEG